MRLLHVSWTGVVLWENATDPGNNTATREDTIAISHLVPYTDYTVTLKWDEVGGQKSDECLAITAEVGKRQQCWGLFFSSHLRKMFAFFTIVALILKCKTDFNVKLLFIFRYRI